MHGVTGTKVLRIYLLTPLHAHHAYVCPAGKYYEAALQLVRPGGLIAVDNVLFYGRVADDSASDAATTALQALNDALLLDERVSVAIVPVGDGMTLCRKR